VSDDKKTLNSTAALERLGRAFAELAFTKGLTITSAIVLKLASSSRARHDL
jgi:hypothetical protein